MAKLEKIAFEELGLVRLEIRMDPRNKASEKVAIKNDFLKDCDHVHFKDEVRRLQGAFIAGYLN